MAVWNGRFKKDLDKEALKFSSSIELDRRMFNEDIDGSIAHVKMLARQKIITLVESKKIVKALEEIRSEIANGKYLIDWTKEDIHSAIEERLIQKIGEAGKRLHTGRSRNDQVALDERLFLKKEINILIKLITGLQKSLLKKAEKYKTTVIPGYTHLQRAQPILFAHHLTAYIEMLERDKERLKDCLKRSDKSPLGAAAFAGTSLPIDRSYTAKLLGFGGIVENSIDAVSSRDFIIELISAMSIIMVNLSRLSEEFILWSSSEFAFAQIDDAYATGSSLMPQKKNPDFAELIRGKSGRVFGALTGILTLMKGLPLAYNRDMQEDKYHLISALDTTKDSLKIAAGMIDHTEFKTDRFEEELTGDLSLATDLLDYLVRKNVPFRKAHHLVGKIVARCVEKGIKLNQLELSEYKKFSPAFEKDLYSLLTPLSSIKKKTSEGSTSPEEVNKALRKWKKKLASA
ncbi:argininosuccinate lyase [Melioribacter sp. OK-6-Me]|uniref:argininosuccinate lyase n=1 Tax=unclassified Melioribacter TaxID=2627329 RepID=UPI003ED94543